MVIVHANFGSKNVPLNAPSVNNQNILITLKCFDNLSVITPSFTVAYITDTQQFSEQ